ncbi:MAG: hypothetical protein JO036_01905 [Candidatus Eremiobacteraeota bacterium]|nr:hypothetical protein [Candidatus Eremiobacteraeota bacterium]
MTQEIRIGGEFSENDLRPEVYETPSGLVEARLYRGGSKVEIEELISGYRIDETPAANYALPHDPGSRTLTTQGTEIVGALTVFARAGVRGAAFHTGFVPPHPDLQVTVDGQTAGLEMTLARGDGAFTAALRRVENLLTEVAIADQALRRVTKDRRISIGFAALPKRARVPVLVDAIGAWLAAHNWSNGDPGQPENPAIAKYVRSVRAFNGADAERPIRATRDINERPIPSALTLIRDAVAAKNNKDYGTTSPLWLGINAEWVGEMLAVKRAGIDPGHFGRIYIADLQDAVTLMRLYE